MNLIFEVLKGLWESSGFAALSWQNGVMIGVAFVFLFLAIKKKYEDLNEETIKPNWYDELRYSSSLKKKVSKKEAARIEALADEYFETYLDVCRDARVCDYDEKKAKADIYRDGLLNNGGPATDTFLKAWGREKSEKFFKEVLFG